MIGCESKAAYKSNIGNIVYCYCGMLFKVAVWSHGESPEISVVSWRGPRTSRQLSQEHSCTSFTDLLDSGSDGQTLRGWETAAANFWLVTLSETSERFCMKHLFRTGTDLFSVANTGKWSESTLKQQCTLLATQIDLFLSDDISGCPWEAMNILFLEPWASNAVT